MGGFLDFLIETLESKGSNDRSKDSTFGSSGYGICPVCNGSGSGNSEGTEDQ